MDHSPVKTASYESAVKSIGNSTTCPRDIKNEQDAHIVFQNLSESVAERMRQLGLMAKTIQISLRSSDLYRFERQAELPSPSMISSELSQAAMTLLGNSYKWDKPLRSVGIRGTNLVSINGTRQLSLWEDEPMRRQSEKMEYVIDDIRRRFGHHSIKRALLITDQKLGKLDAKADHVIHPISYS